MVKSRDGMLITLRFSEAEHKKLSSEPQWEARHAVIESIAESIRLKHFAPNTPH